MSLDMNTAVKTSYSRARGKLPKLKNKVTNLEVVGNSNK
jgi:hypothetical protein